MFGTITDTANRSLFVNCVNVCKRILQAFFRDFKVLNRVMIIKLHYISLCPAIVRLGLSPEVTMNKEVCKVITYFSERKLQIMKNYISYNR